MVALMVHCEPGGTALSKMPTRAMIHGAEVNALWGRLTRYRGPTFSWPPASTKKPPSSTDTARAIWF